MAFGDTLEAQRANRRYIRAAMAAPLLDAAQELDLARRWRETNDQAALHRLVGAYMRLVVSVAAKFRHYGLPMGDLVQEGNIGLMQAAARFDPARQVRFSTYATWWIRAQMQDHVLRNWSIVRTGTTAAQKSLFFNLRRLRAKIERSPDMSQAGGGLSPAARERIARELRVPVADVAAMEQRMTAADRSLNATLGEDGESDWQDMLADDRANPEESLLTTHDGRVRARWLEAALQGLTPRERTIIAERRLRDDEGVTLEHLGHELGISKERVRQIEHQALRKLKQRLEELAGPDGRPGLVG
jgi:RNA polymerase sigma-32 factor